MGREAGVWEVEFGGKLVGSIRRMYISPITSSIPDHSVQFSLVHPQYNYRRYGVSVYNPPSSALSHLHSKGPWSSGKTFTLCYRV
jgi:hypothetical protein